MPGERAPASCGPSAIASPTSSPSTKAVAAKQRAALPSRQPVRLSTSNASPTQNASWRRSPSAFRQRGPGWTRWRARKQPWPFGKRTLAAIWRHSCPRTPPIVMAWPPPSRRPPRHGNAFDTQRMACAGRKSRTWRVASGRTASASRSWWSLPASASSACGDFENRAIPDRRSGT